MSKRTRPRNPAQQLAGDGIPPALAVKDRPRAGDYELTAWADPDVVDPNAREADDLTGGSHRAVKRVRGFRASISIERLHNAYPEMFPATHVASARRLTDDHHVGVLGAHPGSPAKERVDTGQPAGGAIDRQLAALARFRDAMQALGPAAGAVVANVVLMNWSLDQVATEMAQRRGLNVVDSRRASERVAAAMDRLVEHYQDRDQARRPTRTPRPISSGYGQPQPELPSDMPSERVGRWTRPQASGRAT